MSEITFLTRVKIQKSTILYFFQKSGHQGHHTSLYNAGLLLAEGYSRDDLDLVNSGKRHSYEFINTDLVGALAYFQAASTLHIQHPDVAEEPITKIAIEGMYIFYPYSIKYHTSTIFYNTDICIYFI